MLAVAGLVSSSLVSYSCAAEPAESPGTTPPAPDAGRGHPGLEDDLGVPASRGSSGPDGYEAGGDPSKASCFDGVDNDDNARIDCEDEACASWPSCCPGRGACCGPTLASPLPSALDFRGCVTQPVASRCTGGEVAAFGDPGPWVDADGWLHAGGREADGGLVVGAPVDLRHYRLRIDVELGRAGCGAGGCMESAGIAVTEAHPGGPHPVVRPLVGLLASGERDEVVLLVGDERVAAWPFEQEIERWTLTLDPTGRAVVERDGASVSSHPYAAIGASHLVIFGRSENRPAGGPAGSRIGQVAIETTVCDSPTAWSGREPVTALSTPPSGAARSAPSIARRPLGEYALAYESGGAIFVLDPTTDEAWNGGRAILAPSTSYDSNGVFDPELQWDDGGADGAGQWVLFYTAVDAHDVRRIGRATSTPGGAFAPDAAASIDPAELEGTVGVEMPTVARTFDGTWVLVARANGVDGESRLVAFTANSLSGASISDRAPLMHYPHTTLGELTTRRPTTMGLAFDAREIAHPSLVVQNGAFHLYYAGRHGTRWSIGLMTSDDLRHWRTFAEPVLARDPSRLGELGVRAPDVLFHDQRVELVYVADDGVHGVVERAHRMSASHLDETGGSR
jgi:hypothetical protein